MNTAGFMNLLFFSNAYISRADCIYSVLCARRDNLVYSVVVVCWCVWQKTHEKL